MLKKTDRTSVTTNLPQNKWTCAPTFLSSPGVHGRLFEVPLESSIGKEWKYKSLSNSWDISNSSFNYWLKLVYQLRPNLLLFVSLSYSPLTNELEELTQIFSFLTNFILKPPSSKLWVNSPHHFLKWLLHTSSSFLTPPTNHPTSHQYPMFCFHFISLKKQMPSWKFDILLSNWYCCFHACLSIAKSVK